MKRYIPNVIYVHNELTGPGGDAYCEMSEHPKGEYVKLSEVGWKRNCAETPVPWYARSHLILICYYDKPAGYHKIGIPESVDTYDTFLMRDGSHVNRYYITHWLEIPEIEDE